MGAGGRNEAHLFYDNLAHLVMPRNIARKGLKYSKSRKQKLETFLGEISLASRPSARGTRPGEAEEFSGFEYFCSHIRPPNA